MKNKRYYSFMTLFLSFVFFWFGMLVGNYVGNRTTGTDNSAVLATSSAMIYEEESKELSTNDIIMWWLSGRNNKLTLEEKHRICDAIINSVADYGHGVDPLLILAVIDKESDCIVNAKGSALEVGLMQVLPSTGKWISKKMGIEYAEDIETNILLGVIYLSDIYNRYNNDCHSALTGYNKGENGMKKHKATNGTAKSKYSSDVMRRYNAILKVHEYDKDTINTVTPMQLIKGV